jgi:hypothetical protein
MRLTKSQQRNSVKVNKNGKDAAVKMPAAWFFSCKLTPTSLLCFYHVNFCHLFSHILLYDSMMESKHKSKRGNETKKNHKDMALAERTG